MNIENELEVKKTDSIRKSLSYVQNKIASSQYAYLAFCFIVPVLIMYLLYMAIEIHPFGDGTVLVLDLNGQYVYFHEGLRSALKGDTSLLYTFFRTLGGEFIGIYAYYVASPISYIVALFPEDRMLEALLTIILIKVGLCGVSFGFYLHKNSKNRNNIVIVMFSVMYALCAYGVVYQSNMMWIDAMYLLPIVTYSTEQLIKNRRYKLFVISLALTIFCNYYIGYMVCIYVAIYYFYYVFSHEKSEINPHNFKFNRLRSFGRIALFSIIAVSISAFMILGAYYSLSFGKSDFTTTNWAFGVRFNFLDFFTKFLPGSYDTVRPAGLPYVYCGILTVILLPVYFLAKKIPARERIASLFLVSFFILSFMMNQLDLIWHGFQKPNWLNYRYSFIFTFILLVLAYKGLGNLKSAGQKLLLGVTGGLIFLTIVCDKLEFSSYVESNSKLLTLQTVWLTIMASVVILALLCLLIRHKKPSIRRGLTGVLAVVVCIEIFCSSIACMVQFNGDVAYSRYSRYNNFIGGLRPIVYEIQNEDDGFYRMEKIVHRKYNDNMALRMRGLSGSTSTLNADAIAFLKALGYTSRSHLSQYRGGTPVSDSLLGIKYIIDSESSNKLIHLYEKYTTNNGYTAYYNEYAMPIAYSVDSGISKHTLAPKKSMFFDRQNALVGAMLGSETDPDIFVPIPQNATTTNTSADCGISKSKNIVTFTRKNDSNNAYFEYTFIAPKSAEYYFYTPYTKSVETTLKRYDHVYNAEEDEYVKREVSGIGGNYLGNDTNCVMSLGYCEEGQKVTVKILLNGASLKLDTSYDFVWYFDNEAFEEAFTELKSRPQFNVTEYTEDDLKGTIKTVKDTETIQTTIPYDEGWKVYVDGKQVKTYETLDTLMAFDIDGAGNHELELRYAPDIYVVGIMISLLGLITFILICVVDTLIYYVFFKKSRSEAFSVKGDAWVLEDYDKDEEERLLGNDITFRKNSTVKEKLLVILDEFREKLRESKKNGEPAVFEDTVTDTDEDPSIDDDTEDDTSASDIKDEKETDSNVDDNSTDSEENHTEGDV